jgi:hypothetical protein
MPGMGAPAGAPAGFPALAVILALFLLGSVMWTTDQLAALARSRPARQPRADLRSSANWSPSHLLITRPAPPARHNPLGPAAGPAARQLLMAPSWPRAARSR